MKLILENKRKIESLKHMKVTEVLKDIFRISP